jgi:hypothetical protein
MPQSARPESTTDFKVETEDFCHRLLRDEEALDENSRFFENTVLLGVRLRAIHRF